MSFFLYGPSVVIIWYGLLVCWHTEGVIQTMMGSSEDTWRCRLDRCRALPLAGVWLRSSRLPHSPSRSVLRRSSSDVARVSEGSALVRMAFSFCISWMWPTRSASSSFSGAAGWWSGWAAAAAAATELGFTASSSGVKTLEQRSDERRCVAVWQAVSRVAMSASVAVTYNIT